MTKVFVALISVSKFSRFNSTLEVESAKTQNASDDKINKIFSDDAILSKLRKKKKFNNE